MAGFSVAEGPGPAPGIAVVRASGSLDIASLGEFESTLGRLLAAGRVKVVVDLSALEYISSSGLGAFVKTVDPFRARGGDLVFVRVGERLMRLFKTVGFTRLLTLARDEAEALALLEGPRGPVQLILSPALRSPHSGEAFDLEILAADARGMAVRGFQGRAALEANLGLVSPPSVGPFVDGVWHGKVVLTGPGATVLKAALEASPGAAPAASGEVALDVRQDKPPAVLPLTVACPGCGRHLEIDAFNVYRCKGCGEIYFVDKWAHAITLKPGRREEADFTRGYALAFPADVKLLGAVRAFLVAALKERSYAPEVVGDLEMVVDEAVTNVVEHAYSFDARRQVRLELALDRERVEARVKDDGAAFDPLAVEPVNLDRHVEERRTGGLGVHLMRTLMDTVEYRREGAFNVLVLVKKVR